MKRSGMKVDSSALLGLAITMDDEPNPICLVCAERIANESGFPNLFWFGHRPWKVDGEKACKCSRAYACREAEQAAGRIADLLKPNIAVSGGGGADVH